VLYRTYLTVGFSLGYVWFALGCCGLMAAAAWLHWREPDRISRVTRLRRMTSRLCRWYLGYHSRLGLVQVDFEQQRLLGPGVILANHPSLVDALWILATQPHVCCVMKADLQRSWLFRYLVEQLNYVSNRDPEQLLEEGKSRLLAGQTLLVFPEATRTVPGTLPQFRLGAAELLVRSGAPVHPIIIHKRDSYLSKTRPWYHLPKQKIHWRIEFAPSLQPTITDAPRLARRRITAALQQYFHGRLQGHNVAPKL
jgi:1-acyl-sn-glycerol-3-phosphate acyltransferase